MKSRTGFTLVELVVVILILGILAGVAAPRMFDTAARATDNGLRQTLSIVRDAIELYTADPTNPSPGNPPAFANEAAFKLLMRDYIRGDFPSCPVGPVAETDTITSVPEATPSAGVGGWRYDPLTGFFGVHFNGATASDSAVDYDAL